MNSEPSISSVGPDTLKIYVCDVTLSVSTPGKLKNQLDHGGNRTHNLWFASQCSTN